jgi:hypothetical protein
MKCWSRVLCGILLGMTTTVAAQRWAGEGMWSAPMREGLPEQRTGFSFCRLLYSSVRREPMGYGWSTDYPRGDQNFMTRLSELTKTGISHWDDGLPGHAVVRPTDAHLYSCPFLFASDAGTAGFTDVEVERLRAYLLKGGFLWVDDFWGDRAWEHWVNQVEQVLPGLPIVELGPEHPLFSVFYQVPEVPQVPSIQFWYRSGGATSERGAETAQAHLRGIFDEHGRLLVLMSHNSDIADGWERETDNTDFFYAFSGRAYGVGVNVAVWTMSH